MTSGIPSVFNHTCKPDISWPAGDITGNVALGLVPLGMVRGPTLIMPCAGAGFFHSWPFIVLSEPGLARYRVECVMPELDPAIAPTPEPKRRPW